MGVDALSMTLLIVLALVSYITKPKSKKQKADGPDISKLESGLHSLETEQRVTLNRITQLEQKVQLLNSRVQDLEE